MNLLVVSDLHILGSEDPIYLSLLKLLSAENCVQNDIVVMAGDIFDVFVGNKRIFHRRYREFFQALSMASDRGVKFHYIEGNHDFLLKDAFSGIRNLVVHAEEMSLELSGKRFLILHGDTANPGDQGYLRLRAAFRSPLMKGFVKVTPDLALDAAGKLSSRYSRERRTSGIENLSTARLEAMRAVYRRYAQERFEKGYDFILMGHCHDPDEMTFESSGRRGQYLNMGFPPTQGTYLRWTMGNAQVNRAPLP